MKESGESETPSMEEKGIPWWIKIMWAVGILWMLAYVAMGWLGTPETW